ncbi:MAG: thioredoxin family protein [Cyclobacteriaceae bacterium]
MKNLLLLSAITMASIMLAFTSDQPGVEVGDKAPDFRLENVDGTMVSLADHKNAKAYIVIFTCNTCPYAKDWEDRIASLHAKYASKGVPVIAINPNDPAISAGDSFDKMKEISEEKGYEFPYLFDESQSTAAAYGATRTPHAYVLNKDMKVIYIGAIDNNHKQANNADKKYVEDAVESILDNKELKVKSTKSVGCTIKWRKA